jgi:DNA replication protein DnaC
MNDDLEQLLTNLKLPRILQVLDRETQRAKTEAPSYADFLARLLREELQHRQQRSIENRIHKARLPERWSINTFPFDRQPSVKPAVIKSIASLDFIPQRQNQVFIGPTGVGKTGLACAILLSALEQGYRGLFIKAQDLFDDMYASLADRSTRKVLDRLANLDVLPIDDMGYLNLRPEQSNCFFKLMDERYNRHPTIITTNLDYDDWFGFLGKKEMVGALLDRLRHHCQTVRIDGPSLRAPEG